VAALQINENIPDAVKDFIRVYVERQFSDARSMMMLQHCCNFAITALLVNLVSGMSTVLYDQQGGSGRRFKNLLREFYPWEPEQPKIISCEDVIECLYDILRNPLVHSLGVPTEVVKARPGQSEHVIVRKPSGKSFGIDRTWLPEHLLEQLEQSPQANGLIVSEETAGGRTLHVECLYWGVRTMLSPPHKRCRAHAPICHVPGSLALLVADIDKFCQFE
jgi:hypothetical protein